MGYHATTGATGAVLEARRRRTERQEDIVLRMFENSERGWTPDELWEYMDVSWPITSVRRAISNLTRDGKLEKTNIKRMGAYGHETHVWRLAVPSAQLELV